MLSGATVTAAMLATQDETTSAISIEAELRSPAMTAQIVRFDIREPTSSTLRDDEAYWIDMCLTPRPLVAKGGYSRHWGPHRFERLGDIFMIPPGEELSVRGGKSQQASLVCALDPARIHDIVGQDLVWTDRQLFSTLNIGSARIRALLYRLTEELRHPGLAWQDMLELLGGELAIELSRYCLEQEERPVTGGLAGWRLRLIDERLSEDLRAPSLKELSDICNISIRQLTRGFRVSRGCSIGDHIEQRRMETAKRQLMKGRSIKEIAFDMGFASPSSFTFAFRRAVGISPTQFRQRQARGIHLA